MAGVYISFPFCAQKCTFCNFASGVFSHELEEEYYAALQHEVRGCIWPWVPETVYIGGGTPSQMDVDQLAAILAAVPGYPWREATLEAAPGSLTAGRIDAWVRAGINRVSLGVQSFVDRELAQTGRKHTAETVELDCALLRDAGINNINIDLIAGLPHQTEASWRESLRYVSEIDPPHVSVYMLEVDQDSRLGLEILQSGSKYGASRAPSDDLVTSLYELAVEELARTGLERYEISNFAKPGYESLHNFKYWTLAPYLGFGADAHSCDDGQRWGNVETAAEYVHRWQENNPVREQASEADSKHERFFVGLRLTSGLEPEPHEWITYREPIYRFLQEGLLERFGTHLRLTPRGVLLSNEVFQEFLSE